MEDYSLKHATRTLKARAILSVLLLIIFGPLVILHTEKMSTKLFLIVALVLVMVWNVADYVKILKKEE